MQEVQSIKAESFPNSLSQTTRICWILTMLRKIQFLLLSEVQLIYLMQSSIQMLNRLTIQHVMAAKSMKVFTKVIKALQQQFGNIYQGAQITVTGHSLGGALATFCALDLEEIYGSLNLYAFGCPRVGNDAFAKYQEKMIPQAYRIINYADLFNHYPFSSQLYGYHHGGNQVWYSPRGMQKYRICRSEEPTCANSVSKENLLARLLDHNPLDYQKLRVEKSRQLR